MELLIHSQTSTVANLQKNNYPKWRIYHEKAKIGFDKKNYIAHSGHLGE